MPELKTQLHGLNTEQHPDRLRSGAADVALNVTVHNGVLQKRGGFAELEDDVTGAADGVLKMAVAPFGDGDVYLVCKCDDGYLWQQKMYPTAAGSFTKITTGWTHNASDPGSFFMHGDRLYYCDRGGVSKWNPDVNSGTAYKAGLRRPSTGPLIAAGAGGEKHGHYHVHMAYRNSVTGEEGVITAAQTGYLMPLECRIEDPDTRSGLYITTWATIKAQDTDYEWDQAIFYCTKGNTEWISLGDGAEVFSYKCYEDVVANKTQHSVGLNKSDEVLDAHQYAKNSGGEPPASRFCCFDGRQAVYGGIHAGTNASYTTVLAGDNNDLTYTALRGGEAGNSITIAYTTGGTAGSEVVTVSGTAISVKLEAGVSTATQVATAVQSSTDASALVTVANATGNDGTGTIAGAMSAKSLAGGAGGGGSIIPSRIDFSIPNQPAMVPHEEAYTLGGDAKRFVPKPWVGRIHSGLAGELTGLAAGGGVICAFTPTSVYALTDIGDGRLWPSLITASSGCVASTACIGTPHGVFAVGYNTISRIGRSGFDDLTADRLTATLEDIPAAQQTDAIAGYYGYAGQVWFAVTKSGATVAKRILVLDAKADDWVIFEPACLGTAGITAMVELAIPNAAPTMLVATSNGRVLQYPSGTDDDDTDFEAQWRGYFGQERCQYDQRLEAVAVRCGESVAGNVTVGLRSMRTGGETVTQTTTVLGQSNAIDPASAELSPIDGNLFQIEFYSGDEIAAQWDIKGLSLRIERIQ